ncbi:hypothetical protein MUP77_09920 [Candidatus Bathyarchaeota archaeon]|nr:hypothetical protein [Candidatus Bathyarchaeota archaeon]
MLGPGGVYETIVASLETRSLDIEPITFFHLAKLNPDIHRKILGLATRGGASLFPSTYSHPILPLLVSESFLEAKINVRWGVEYLLARALNSNSFQTRSVFFWLSECAYSSKAAQAILSAIHEIHPNTQIFLLLDEFQGQDIDPRQPYMLRLENGEIGLVFRSRWVSDAYAFSQNADWLANSLRADILQRRPELIGVAIDAETYGGAYESDKPLFFTEIREKLDSSVSEGNTSVPVQFIPVDKAIQNACPNYPAAKLLENSSWSNYFESQLLHPQSDARTGILARKLGPLCRWTGLVPGISSGKEETYFLVYDWTDPYSRKTYTRVVASLWKIAYNALRSRGAALVRQTVLDLLPPLLGSGSLEEALGAYGEVVFEVTPWSGFASRFKIGKTSDEIEVSRLLLEAYRMADQEAAMSDPTYWENMDTEVTWTALALLAAGTINAAKACLQLKEYGRFEELASEYNILFLDFEASFREIHEEYDCPFDILFNYLREQCWKKGYDLKHDLASGAVTEEQARIIAARAYETAFNKDWKRPLKESDVNPYVILWKMKEMSGLLNDADEILRRAYAYEWEKSIRSTVSNKPIPVRVGLLHAKHFPKNEIFKPPAEEPETDTEFLSGEADAYT